MCSLFVLYLANYINEPIGKTCQSWFDILPNIAKLSKMLPKWRNLAQSGHAAYNSPSVLALGVRIVQTNGAASLRQLIAFSRAKH